VSEPFTVRDGSQCLKKEQIGPLKTSKQAGSDDDFRNVKKVQKRKVIDRKVNEPSILG